MTRNRTQDRPVTLQSPIPAAHLAAAGALWAFLLIPRQVRAIGYVEREDDLLIRQGVLFRSMLVVPYGRMQYVDVEAGPLARKLGISTVTLHTAAHSMLGGSVPGLETAAAESLRDRLAERGESRMAGL